MFSWPDMMDWLASLDPKTRIAIVALCQEIGERNDWTVRTDEYPDIHEIVGTLEGLVGVLEESNAAVTSIARNPLAREELVQVLTYLEPMWRMRFSWEAARFLPDTEKGERPTSLLDAALNDHLVAHDENGEDQTSMMRHYLRVVVGMVARARLAMDLVNEERLDRVTEAMMAASRNAV